MKCLHCDLVIASYSMKDTTTHLNTLNKTTMPPALLPGWLAATEYIYGKQARGKKHEAAAAREEGEERTRASTGHAAHGVRRPRCE